MKKYGWSNRRRFSILTDRVGCFTMACLMLATVTASQALAAEKEGITLSVNTMEILDVPFSIQGFRCADPAIAKGELVADRKLRVVGLSVGITDLQVTGAGGATQSYTVNVVENIRMVLAAMRSALDEVPEVDLSVSLGKVMIKGEISNLRNWNMLKKVVAAYGKGAVMDLTTLRMPPELILRLREGLERAGFNVAADQEKAGGNAPGTLSVEGSGRAVYVHGTVFSTGDISKIHSVVAAQNWLSVEAKSGTATESDEQTYTVIVDVAVAPVMLEVDVAFLAITDSEQQKIGVNLLSAGLLTIQAAGALAGDATRTWSAEGGSRTVDGVKTVSPNVVSRSRANNYDNSASYSVAANLAGTLNFFIAKHPDRLIEKAHFTFKNDAVDWKTYHSGGTLKIRVVSENTASIEDIDYGLQVKVKGGLFDADNAALDTELELSVPEKVAGTMDYDLKRDRLFTSLNCPVGHTVIMGGASKLLESVDESATPVLRSIPLLKHLFSEKASSRIEKRILILMSCQIAGAPRPAAPISEETLRLLEETNTPPQDRERKNKRRFFFF